MDGMELEVYNVLTKIVNLDANIYSDLIKIYKEDIVNQVIERMIDMDDNNIFKFEYYISKVLWFDDVIAKTLFDAYLIDLKTLPVLSGDESRKIAIEIHEVVSKLRKILDIPEKKWISDEVEKYLKEMDETNKRKEIEELYNKFIYKRNVLVEGNLKFVIFVAKKCCIKNVDICEIIQFGNIGLMRASEKYNPSFKTCFTTYSYHWIKHNIMKEMASMTSPFCVSYNMASFNMTMKKAINELRLKFKREPLVEEIAYYMEEPLDKIRTCLLIFSIYYSLDEPLRTCDDEDYTRLDSLEDNKADIFNMVLQKNLSKDLMEFLNANLTEKELMVLCHRYELFDYDYKKLQALGVFLGLSTERVRQIEKTAVQKIKRKGRYLSKYVD